MFDKKQWIKYNVILTIVVFFFLITAPYIFKQLEIDNVTVYESVTYKVKEVYEEKNQSIYGTWRT